MQKNPDKLNITRVLSVNIKRKITQPHDAGNLRPEFGSIE